MADAVTPDWRFRLPYIMRGRSASCRAARRDATAGIPGALNLPPRSRARAPETRLAAAGLRTLDRVMSEAHAIKPEPVVTEPEIRSIEGRILIERATETAP